MEKHLLNLMAGVQKFAQTVSSALQAISAAVNDAKLLITELAGAGGTLAGIGSLVGWQYALIIGGVAVIFAIERQPSATESAVASKAAQLKAALMAAKAGGKFDVMIDDVIKVL